MSGDTTVSIHLTVKPRTWPSYRVKVNSTDPDVFEKENNFKWYSIDTGRERWEDINIFSNPPTVGELEVFLISVDKEMSTNEALLLLEDLGFRPASLAELFYLGVQHPLLQRRGGAIVELGSQNDRDRFGILCVEDDTDRSFTQEDPDNFDDHKWPANYRFAAVRKDK